MSWTEPTPDPRSPYAVRLGQLTGTHYLPVVDDGADEPDREGPPPGSSVAYIAERPKEHRSGYTVEGYIEALGDFAAATARNPGAKRRLGRIMALVVLVPFVTLVLERFWQVFR